MATDLVLTTIPLAASADLSSYQNRFVILTTSSQAALCGNGELADGVLYNASDADAAGKTCQVAQGPIVKVEAGAAIAATGTVVASDATGRVVTAASGDSNLGKNLDAAAAAGDMIRVLFHPNGATA